MDTFNKDYVEYWKKRVESVSDGSKAADMNVANSYFQLLNVLNFDKVLDLGCGHGRFFPLLSRYTSNIFGLDVNYDALNEASAYPYTALVRGRAEDTNFASNSFDKVIAWGVFDVVEQELGFKEVNRILKKDGIFLVTGKNFNYSENDHKAFIAERNAKLKDFPNHFTDVVSLIRNSQQLGFKVLNAFVFKNRGDLGENRYIEINKDNIDSKFYEFVLILQKQNATSIVDFNICYEFSKTSCEMADEQKFNNIIEFFKWHKENSDE
jgi:ubiquinone/menaquinone biosynthesis C-methylase UbiE